jgi:hypothetical protein
MKTIILNGVSVGDFVSETEIEIENTDLIDMEESNWSDWDYSKNPTREVKRKTINLKPGWKLTQIDTNMPGLQSDVDMLKNEMKILLEVYVEDKALQERHPALKDLYEKYQVTKELLKKNDEEEDPAP